jgi:tripartite-type tricarboxylate transporter receptor subunit TctC
MPGEKPAMWRRTFFGDGGRLMGFRRFPDGLVRVAVAVLCSVAMTAKEARAADDYPNRAIRIVVGFAPGRSSDTAARLVGERLSKRLGQPVIIENKPGAGGMTATTQVLNDPADGYSLLLQASAHSVAAAIRAKLPFDPVDDLEWVSTVSTYGMVVGVRPGSPYKLFAELIAAAKAKPGSISFYSVGFGTAHHLLGEWINAATGAGLVHVPYRGSSLARADFLGGRVDVMIDTMTFAYPQSIAGSVRPLAVTTSNVPAEMKDVTFSGDVVPGLAYESWLGIAARKGIPPAVADRLRREIVAIVGSDEFGQQMRLLGANATSSNGPEFAGRVKREIVGFNKVIDARGIERQ